MMTARDRLGRLNVVVAGLCVVAACSTPPAPNPGDKASVENMVFLTRQGCVNTATMRENLDDALRALARQANYQLIDVDTLPASDPRAGYGTPTVLYDGRDLFGMAEPPAPHPPAT